MVALALQRIGASHAEMREYEERIVRHRGRMIDELSEFGGRFGALMQHQIRLPTQVHGIKQDAPLHFISRAHLKRSRGLEKLDGL